MKKDVKYECQEEKLIIKGYEREESYGEKLENDIKKYEDKVEVLEVIKGKPNN